MVFSDKTREFLLESHLKWWFFTIQHFWNRKPSFWRASKKRLVTNPSHWNFWRLHDFLLHHNLSDSIAKWILRRWSWWAACCSLADLLYMVMSTIVTFMLLKLISRSTVVHAMLSYFLLLTNILTLRLRPPGSRDISEALWTRFSSCRIACQR